MPKRFTDSEKWKRVWFLELKPVHKCLWFYILDNCSTGGVWEVNWKAAEFHIGGQLNRAETEKVFKKQYHLLDGGRRWFIVDFITFQYGSLNPNNPAHKGALKELQSYSIAASDGSISLPDNASKGASEELPSTFEGTMDMVKDKDMVKDMDKGKDKAKETFGEFSNVTLTDLEYGKLCNRLGTSDRAKVAIEILSAYKESKGKTYKSDYAAIGTWVIQELEKREASNGRANDKHGTGRDADVATFKRVSEEAQRRINR